MIECAWDATHHVVLLHRSVRSETEAADLRIAVAYDGGTDQYFAGVFPAACRLWAVQAPASGRFRLAFYPAYTDGDTVGAPAEPLREVWFDRQLTLPPGQPVGFGRKLCGRIYGPRRGSRRVHMSMPWEVEPGHSLADWLDEHKLRPPLGFGISVALCQDGAQGPALHPYRAQETGVPVCIARLPDPGPLPEDSLCLRGFEPFGEGDRSDDFHGLTFPVFDVDLTAFGAAAEQLRLGLTFFHRPFLGNGPGEAVRRVHGGSLPTRESDGRRFVRWACRDGCHRDVLGVHLAGHLLTARTSAEDSNCLLREPLEPGACITVVYLGDRCMPHPPLEEIVGAGQEVSVDLAAVEVARFASWIVADERLHSQAALSGAQQAEACTLFAYVELLGELGRVIQENGGRDPVAPLLRPLGLGLRSFAEFARRPDLAFALVGLPELRARLAAVGDRLRAPAHGAGMSLVAFLAAALEPGEADLAGWVDAHPAAQPLLWCLLLAGVHLSRLRSSGLELDGPVTEPGRLAANLDLCLDPAARALAAALLEDLGQDATPLVGVPSRLTDVEPICRLMERADVRFADDLARATQLLLEAGLPAPHGVAEAKAAFGRNLAQGGVSSRDALLAQVLRASNGQRFPGSARVPSEVRTRAALMAIIVVLEGRAPPPPPRIDCAGLVLAWSRRVLAGGDATWVTGDPMPAPEQASVLTDLERAEHKWLSPEGEAKSVLPVWTSARKVRQRVELAEVAAGARAARDWLQGSPGGGGDEGLRHGAIIDRTERLAPWLIAQRIWSEAAQPVTDGKLPQLLDRVRLANRNPVDWESVAAAIAAATGQS